MASPFERLSPASGHFKSKRLQSFRRPGAEPVARRASLEENPGNARETAAVQVLIPRFKTVDQEDSQSRAVDQQKTLQMREKTLKLSTSRQAHSWSPSKDQNRIVEQLDDVDGTHNVQQKARSSTFGIQVDDSGAGDSSFVILNSAKAWFPLRFLAKVISTLHLLFHIRKQTPGKRIAADKDVLSTYHESILYGRVSLSTKVRAGIRGPPLSSILLMLECIAALLLLTLYARTTYTSKNPKWITVVQFCASIFFLLDYIIKLYSAPVRAYYALSLNGIVDFISTFPIYFILSGIMPDAAIPEVFLVFRLLRAVPLISLWLLPGGAVAQEICLLITYALGICTA